MNASEYKAARERLGTQAELAARLGVARSTVAYRERGDIVITTEAALALSALAKTKRKRSNTGSSVSQASADANKLPSVVGKYGGGR